MLFVIETASSVGVIKTRGKVYTEVSSRIGFWAYYRPLLYEALGIHAQDIVMDNPYVQKTSGRKKGCQIDYLVQMHSNTLFICEIKMRRKELDLEVIQAMKTKIGALSLPKGMGIAPVLFYLGPVSDALLTSSFFYRMIDITDLK